jgi:RNA polymerase sigma-70 factor, ECF subfamily
VGMAVAETNPRSAVPAPSPAAPVDSEFERDLTALIPHLRAFSRSLCRNRTLAEDLTQEALARAWGARARFETGSSLKAWVFTILRNEFYSHRRRAWREASWDAEKAERIAAPANQQDWTMELADAARALGELPAHQRQAVILFAAGGVSFEDAAKLCGTRVGALKSRLLRGRIRLSGILDGGTPLPRRSAKDTKADAILAQLAAVIPASSSS